VWRDEARRGTAARAHRVLMKAYACFRASRGERAHVRFLTARRWIFTALAFARRGEIREAAIHVAYALRWHPLGALQGAATVIARTLTALRLRPTVEEHPRVEESDPAGLRLGEQVEKTRA
jgi:hypothetical protein